MLVTRIWILRVYSVSCGASPGAATASSTRRLPLWLPLPPPPLLPLNGTLLNANATAGGSNFTHNGTLPNPPPSGSTYNASAPPYSPPPGSVPPGASPSAPPTPTPVSLQLRFTAQDAASASVVQGLLDALSTNATVAQSFAATLQQAGLTANVSVVPASVTVTNATAAPSAPLKVGSMSFSDTTLVALLALLPFWLCCFLLARRVGCRAVTLEVRVECAWDDDARADALLSPRLRDLRVDAATGRVALAGALRRAVERALVQALRASVVATGASARSPRVTFGSAIAAAAERLPVSGGHYWETLVLRAQACAHFGTLAGLGRDEDAVREAADALQAAVSPAGGARGQTRARPSALSRQIAQQLAPALRALGLHVTGAYAGPLLQLPSHAPRADAALRHHRHVSEACSSSALGESRPLPAAGPGGPSEHGPLPLPRAAQLQLQSHRHERSSRARLAACYKAEGAAAEKVPDTPVFRGTPDAHATQHVDSMLASACKEAILVLLHEEERPARPLWPATQEQQAECDDGSEQEV